ncbi:hypothetical protein [Saccharopolyspora pogona]|uniref:hypothetical protein n=1 Tax=Saccharopolyspora pogona TaxID=333966 RepID=UPI001688DA92|nr:hypothetical protein [Saccharopolyspora pogona]
MRSAQDGYGRPNRPRHGCQVSTRAGHSTAHGAEPTEPLLPEELTQAGLRPHRLATAELDMFAITRTQA